MNGALMLARRNALCFFRDRPAVVFSFLTALVVLVLYFLFLRNVLVDSMYMQGWTILSKDDVPALMDTWAMAGVIGIVSVTSCAGSLQCMVDDKVSGKIMDLRVSPVGPSGIVAGYVLSTFFVGLTISAVTLAIALAIMFCTGISMDAGDVVACILLLIPSTLSSSIIMFSLASFIKSLESFSGFTIVMSALIGLLYGIYMPMVDLPGAVTSVGNLMPATHMAALFRQCLCSEPLAKVLGPVDASAFRDGMGVDISLGDFRFDALSSILYVLAVTALFFAVSVLAMRKKKDVRSGTDRCRKMTAF